MRTTSLALAFGSVLLLALSPACDDGETPSEGGGGSGGNGTTASGTTKASSTSSTASSSASSTADTSSSTNGTGGAGGAEWPTCETQPPGSPTKTIPDIWADDPAMPAEAWVPGVYVTAISGDGCVSGQACQFFVQQEESYATLAAAAHQSLRVGVAPAAAEHFEALAVGDQIDLYAHAFRDTEEGKNELLFLVTPALPGCALAVGSGDSQPVTVTLDQLSVATYETDVGPVLVRVETVSGNPNLAAETFALWDTGAMPGNDITTVTSLSPFFASGAAFTGLVDGMNTDFAEVVGVFGLFVPPADPLIKYEEIYVRSVADYPAL